MITSLIKLYYKEKTLKFQTPDAFISRGDKNTAYIYLVAPYDNMADVRGIFGLPSKIDRPTELAILIGTEQSEHTDNEVWQVWQTKLNEPTLQSASRGNTSKMQVNFQVTETLTTPSAFTQVGYYTTEAQLNSFLPTPTDNDYAGVGIGLDLGSMQAFLAVSGSWVDQGKTIDEFELENDILRTENQIVNEIAIVAISPDIESTPAILNDQTLLDPIFANLALLNGKVANIENLLGDNGENFMPSDIKQNLSSAVDLKDTDVFPINGDTIRAVIDDIRIEWSNKIGQFPLIADLPINPDDNDWAFVLENSSFYGGKDSAWVKLNDVHYVAKQISFSIFKTKVVGKDKGNFPDTDAADAALPIPVNPLDYNGYFFGVTAIGTSTLYGYTTTIVDEKVEWNGTTFVATGVLYTEDISLIDARLVIVESKTINIDEAETSPGETKFNGNIILGANGEIIAEDLNFTDDKLIAAVNDLLGFYLDKRSADNTLDGNLLIKGNLTIEGNFSTINVTDVEIDDNIIVLNAGETGNGVSLGTSGFEIDRGTATNYQLVFNESTGQLEGGLVGTLEKIIRQSDLDDALIPKIEGIILRKGSVVIVANSFDFNFVGDGVTISDDGNGKSTITIPGIAGGAPQVPSENVLTNPSTEGFSNQKLSNEDKEINMLRLDEVNQPNKAGLLDDNGQFPLALIPNALTSTDAYFNEVDGNGVLINTAPSGPGTLIPSIVNIIESPLKSFVLNIVSKNTITPQDKSTLQVYFKNMALPATGGEIASVGNTGNNVPLSLVDELVEYEMTYDNTKETNNEDIVDVDINNNVILKQDNAAGYLVRLPIEVLNTSNVINKLEAIYFLDDVEIDRQERDITPNGSPEIFNFTKLIVPSTTDQTLKIKFQGETNGPGILSLVVSDLNVQSNFTETGATAIFYDLRFECIANVDGMDYTIYDKISDNVNADLDGSHLEQILQIVNEQVETLNLDPADGDNITITIYGSSNLDTQPIDILVYDEDETSLFTFAQAKPGSQLASDILTNASGELETQELFNEKTFERRSAYQLQNVAGSDFYVDAKDFTLTPYRLFTQKYPATVVVNQLARVSYEGDNEPTYKFIVDTDGTNLFGESFIPDRVGYAYYNEGDDNIVHMFYDGDRLRIDKKLLEKLDTDQFILRNMGGVGVIKAGWLCGYDDNNILTPIIPITKITAENPNFIIESTSDQVINGSVADVEYVFQLGALPSGEWSRLANGIRRDGIDTITDFKTSGFYVVEGNNGSFPLTIQETLFEDAVQVGVLPGIIVNEPDTIPITAPFSYNAKNGKVYTRKVTIASGNAQSIVTIQSGTRFEAFDTQVVRYVIEQEHLNLEITPFNSLESIGLVDADFAGDDEITCIDRIFNSMSVNSIFKSQFETTFTNLNPLLPYGRSELMITKSNSLGTIVGRADIVDLSSSNSPQNGRTQFGGIRNVNTPKFSGWLPVSIGTIKTYSSLAEIGKTDADFNLPTLGENLFQIVQAVFDLGGGIFRLEASGTRPNYTAMCPVVTGAIEIWVSAGEIFKHDIYGSDRGTGKFEGYYSNPVDATTFVGWNLIATNPPVLLEDFGDAGLVITDSTSSASATILTSQPDISIYSCLVCEFSGTSTSRRTQVEIPIKNTSSLAYYSISEVSLNIYSVRAFVSGNDLKSYAANSRLVGGPSRAPITTLKIHKVWGIY